MSTRSLLFAPAALLCMNAGVVQANAAQVDYFLKLEGIQGESTRRGEEGAIEVESFQWGVTAPTDSSSGTGAGTGKVIHHPLTITKHMDKASPQLLLACANGKHFPGHAFLTIVVTGGDSYKGAQPVLLKLDMEDVTVNSVTEDGNGHAVPTESVSLNFGRISIVPAVQNKETTVLIDTLGESLAP